MLLQTSSHFQVFLDEKWNTDMSFTPLKLINKRLWICFRILFDLELYLVLMLQKRLKLIKLEIILILLNIFLNNHHIVTSYPAISQILWHFSLRHDYFWVVLYQIDFQDFLKYHVSEIQLFIWIVWTMLEEMVNFLFNVLLFLCCKGLSSHYRTIILLLFFLHFLNCFL